MNDWGWRELGNCSRLQDSKETRRLNVTYPCQWNPGSKRLQRTSLGKSGI